MSREIKFKAWDSHHEIFLTESNLRFTGINIAFTLPEIVWLQYTGLKDKNGKEIYEGDVIKYRGYEVSNGKQIRTERTMIVEFTPEKLYQIHCIISMEDVEIIGNIYENPELLTNN